MRITVCTVALALVACGTDVRSNIESTTQPDAAVDGPTTIIIPDAMPIPPDGIPPDLTPCEEAAYHSDLDWIQREVFDVSCTTRCHGDSPPASSMSLRAGQSYAALVNVTSRTDRNWLRVAPGNPGASMLMVQLGGEPGPELEGFMPWGQPMLCAPMIDSIRRWIAAGANP